MKDEKTYYILSGQKGMNAYSSEREEFGLLRWPASGRVAQRLDRAWSVSDCRGIFRRGMKGLRFLLLDIENEDILGRLNWGEQPDGFRSVTEARLPDDAEVEDFELGHHDVVSSFSFCRGILSDRIVSPRDIPLTDPTLVQDLIDKGLFAHHEGALFSNLAADEYGQWLIENNHLDVFRHFEQQHFRVDRLATIAARSNRPEFFQHWIDAGVALTQDTIGHCREIAEEQGLLQLLKLVEQIPLGEKQE